MAYYGQLSAGMAPNNDNTSTGSNAMPTQAQQTRPPLDVLADVAEYYRQHDTAFHGTLETSDESDTASNAPDEAGDRHEAYDEDDETGVNVYNDESGGDENDEEERGTINEEDNGSDEDDGFEVGSDDDGLNRSDDTPGRTISDDEELQDEDIDVDNESEDTSDEDHNTHEAGNVSEHGTEDLNEDIPDEVFAAVNQQPYDRNWMALYHVGESILSGFTSKLKLDHLFKHGAIKPDDKFRVDIGDDPSVYWEGTVLNSCSNAPNNPDVRIKPPMPDDDGVLKGCTGPMDFAKAVRQASNGQGKVPSGWHDVRVITPEGNNLGSLFNVRQAYHVWDERHRAWAARNNVAGPRIVTSKRARPATKVEKPRKVRRRT